MGSESSSEGSTESRGPAGNPAFTTTRWSAVLEAGETDSPRALEALEQLCRTYWYPLYTFVRRSGHNPEDARDLTQEFFARLIAKHWVADADPARGRFRAFLLTALKRFLINEWHHGQCAKRGGGLTFISLEAVAAEERYALESPDPATPELLYDRRWAITQLEAALAHLAAECQRAGEGERFAALQPCLLGRRAERGYAVLAAQLGLTESAVKSAVHRWRLRLRELLRAEIAQTVGSEAEVELELRHMFEVLQH